MKCVSFFVSFFLSLFFWLTFLVFVWVYGGWVLDCRLLYYGYSARDSSSSSSSTILLYSIMLDCRKWSLGLFVCFLPYLFAFLVCLLVCLSNFT